MASDPRDDGEGLLSRWAKRKEAVRQEEETEAAALAEPAQEPVELPEPETEEEALAQLSEAEPELAEQLSAIDIDKLTFDDDFTVFMQKKVPQIIRRRALSKLWLSHPILANLDGMNEYDEDYTQAADAAEMVRKAFEAARLKEEEARRKKEKELLSRSEEPVSGEDEDEGTQTAALDEDDLVEEDDGDLEA
ncbi:MAG: DUF3306 domain-containing protein [Pseudomonadota bacterium]